MSKVKKRIEYLDTARSLSMLWIIGVWHFHPQIIGFQDLNHPIFSAFTIIALAVFSFLSGYFMYASNKSMKDVLAFYVRRLRRFYLFYFIACCSMLMAYNISGNPEMMNPRQFILSVCGLSTFIGPAPITLWFMAMIMLFYIITPLLNNIERKVQFILVSLVFEVVFVFGTLMIHTDKRMLVYFPVYIFGLYIRKYHSRIIKSAALFGGATIVTWIALVVSVILYVFVDDTTFYKILIGVSSIMPCLTISKMITRGLVIKVADYISTASLVAYLFHAQYYWCIELLFGKINAVFAYLCVLPIFIVACYYVQIVYSYIIERLIKSRV